MTSERLARYETLLRRLEKRGQRRLLTQQRGIDFTSNDYLGLIGSRRLNAEAISVLERGVPIGAGGSRLLRGNHPEHDALESEAASFFGPERMLYFGSGYAANLAILSTLPQRGDIVLYDALVHASVHAGISAGRADAIEVPHNDIDAFDDAIRKWRKAGGMGYIWIAVESLYSMTGDRAPLIELAELANRHDGFLLVDEAHATGVHGTDGRGLAVDLAGHDNVLVLHSCGKALGASGALVGGNRLLCDYLLNRARPFIYATAPSPFQAASVRQTLKILTGEPERREQLQNLITSANAQVVDRLGIKGSGSQILPIVIGDNSRTMCIAARMQADGFDIRSIRPPTVPAGTARLRLTITLNVDLPTIVHMLDRLERAMTEAAS